jgi:hypothetical protein
MARIRSIHPGLWTDEAFVSVSSLARLLHIGIWNECDDMGAFEWKPITLKMRLLPIDNVDVPSLLEELTAANMVARYTVAGRDYGAVRNFGRYQRPKKPKSTFPMTDEMRRYAASEAQSSEPDEDEGGSGSGPASTQETLVPKKAELKVVKAVTVFPSAEIAPQMEDGGDNKEEKKEPSLRSVVRSSAAKADPEFAAFYSAYPRHQAPDDGLKAWRAVVSNGTSPAEIMAGLAQHRFNPNPEYIPLPASWLRAGRWKDEPIAAQSPRSGSAESSTERRIRERDERMMQRALEPDPSPLAGFFPLQGRLN